MKIFLVTMSPVSHRTSEENLGIEYISANLIKNGYEVEIIDAWLLNLSEEEVYNKLISEKSLFIGFSSYMTNTDITLKLIKRLKEHNNIINIVCGGFGPTFYTLKYLNNYVDIVSIGEGEETLVEIADYYSGKKQIDDIKSIAYMKNGILIKNEMRSLLENLDDLPFPTRANLQVSKSKKSAVNVVSSRGCSGACEFCSVVAFFRLSKGKIYRSRSIENIVDELEYLYKNGGTFVKFVDDSFIDGKRDESWAKAFDKEITKRKIKLHMRGQIRADKVSDKILYHLKHAGFFSFAVGIENASDKALLRMNKKANKDDNQKCIDLFKKHDLIMQMGFILFDKYTTIDELMENYEFLLKNKQTVTKGIFSEMYSAEGTKLNEELRKNNLLIEENSNNKYEIDNKEVVKIYNSLKLWHKSHSYIYDKIIDPITAPKAIGLQGINEFYNLFLKLKIKDLEIFKLLLDNIDKDVEELIKNNEEFYIDVNIDADNLYKKYEIIYDADNNPFI